LVYIFYAPIVYAFSTFRTATLSIPFIFSLTFENVFDRLEVAELYGTEKLKSACSRMISENLKMLKRKPEWIEMQKNSPKLAQHVKQAGREYEKQCLRKKKEACPYILRSKVKQWQKEKEEAESSGWVRWSEEGEAGSSGSGWPLAINCG
jgi:hypothetical protein